MRFPDANPPRENTAGALIASARREAIRTAPISRDKAEQHWDACHITPHSRDNINRRVLRLDKIRNFGH
jgi:hypothetical protein